MLLHKRSSPRRSDFRRAAVWPAVVCWAQTQSARPNGQSTTGMNTKRLFGAFITAFTFAFLFEWLLHGVILRGNEAALPQGLARAPADFQSHFPWVVVGEAIMIFIFTMIYARGFAAGGVRAGVGLGIMFGIIYTGANLISYGVQPLSRQSHHLV